MYPALSVVEALGNEANPQLWIGSQGGMEADLVQRAGIPYASIPSAGVHGVDWKTLPGNFWKLLAGFLAALRLVQKFDPEVLLFTGGYVAVPVALAAWGRPMVLFVPDIQPGMALNFLARFASCIAVSVEETREYISQKAKVVVTGYPTRPNLLGWERNKAREELGLENSSQVLMVLGGSKGAHSINRSIISHLPQFLEAAQVVHISGALDWNDVQAAKRSLAENQAGRYHPFEYIHEIGQVLAASDAVVSRAGASILGEYPLFGLPAILVPYPYAWKYQKANADYLVSRGAALLIEDEKIDDQLLPAVQQLLADGNRLRTMQQAMQQLAQPQAANKIADLVRQQVTVGSRKREG